MMTARTLAACTFGVVLLTPGLAAAQAPLAAHPLGASSIVQYRNFALKSDVATVAAAAGMAAADAKVVHRRPELLQDLEWFPSRWIAGSMSPSTDPVEHVAFSFYNDQLFRIVVDYARDRTEGMTDADMVEAISAVYGTPAPRAAVAARAASRVEAESGTTVARWGDAGHRIALYRTAMYGDGYRLIVTESDLDRLAQKATVEAEHLDERDAPRLESARQQKERDDGRAAAAKARLVNKAVFRP